MDFDLASIGLAFLPPDQSRLLQQLLAASQPLVYHLHGRLGLTAVCCAGQSDLAAGLAVALAIGAMYPLRCLHPPGGAVAIPCRAPRVKPTAFERQMRAILKEFALNKPAPAPAADAQAQLVRQA